jgi:hypothetical protein
MSDLMGIDRARAERLLDGSDPATDQIGQLLAAARSHARPAELARAGEALDAFRRSHHGMPVRHRVQHRRPAWRRLVGVKAAAIAFALASAGVAVAAGTGVLPTPLTDDATPAPFRATTPGGPWSSRTGTDPSTSGVEEPNLTPSAGADHTALVGLCRAYQAHGDRDPGSSMDSTSFNRLVTAAGGVDRVAEYCVALLAAEPTATATPTATPTATASTEDDQGDDSGVGTSQGRSAPTPRAAS